VIIQHNIISLSNQKYSSNVVERSIEISETLFRNKFLKELYTSNKIITMMKNKFGVFVYKKGLSFIKKDETLKSEIKEGLVKNIGTASSKDKVKLSTILEML